jgi:hypothetical protein
MNGSPNQEDLHGSACRAPSIPDGDRSDDLRLAVPRTDARKILGPIDNDAALKGLGELSFRKQGPTIVPSNTSLDFQLSTSAMYELPCYGACYEKLMAQDVDMNTSLIFNILYNPLCLWTDKITGGHAPDKASDTIL